MNEIYSEIIIELYKNPLNKGTIKDADITTEGGNPTCGDQAKIYLKLQKDKITEVKFVAKGCAISVASLSILTEMIKGKTLNEAAGIKPEMLFKEIGNVIQTRQKCALLGLSILKKGIEEYNQKHQTKKRPENKQNNDKTT